MIIQSRRGFITGLTSLLGAPAIVRVQNIMPVRSMKVNLSELLLWPSPKFYSWFEWDTNVVSDVIKSIPNFYNTKTEEY